MRSRADAAPALIYAPEIGTPGSRLALTDEEGHYATRVCRARVGDRLSGTDGRGQIARLRLVSIVEPIEVEVESIDQATRSRRLEAWCGAPEGQRADWMIEKLAELGVAAWLPIQCERGAWSGARIERWRRLAIAAMRQSRRGFLMEVRDPVGVETALERLDPGATPWLASATGEAGLGPGPAESWSVAAIGPAGGFSETEVGRFEARGFQSIRLADARLRSETAAIAWAARWARG
jgi:16S rRNA (uracil1498-N3)-methyltransferase